MFKKRILDISKRQLNRRKLKLKENVLKEFERKNILTGKLFTENYNTNCVRDYDLHSNTTCTSDNQGGINNCESSIKQLFSSESEKPFIPMADNDTSSLIEDFNGLPKWKDEMLRETMFNIVVSKNVSKEVTESFLKMLFDYGIDVPKTKAALISEFKMKIDEKYKIKNISEHHQYLHIGIQKNLQMIEHELSLHSEIKLDIGIDGVPLYKSSSTSIWPILGAISNSVHLSPFIIGVFLGKGHPKDVNEFLNDFIVETNLLKKNGALIVGIRKPFKIRLFCCDTPAKSMLVCSKSHNSYNGCHKCDQIGDRFLRRTVFSTVCGKLRTDESFILREDQQHHSNEYYSKLNILEQNGFGMVSQFPLDYMHLANLGCTKKILLLLCAKNKNRLQQFSNEYIKLKPFVTSEFSRKPRCFSEVSRFKATEFRLFDMYTGIVILKKFVSTDQYFHFLKYACALRILCAKTSDLECIDLAERLLKEFVEDFHLFYGKENLSYNVHNLLHLSACVRQFGPLDSFSAYKFENYLQILRNKIKKPTQIFKQIINRVEEIWSIKTTSKNSVWDRSSINFSPEFVNSICLLNGGIIFKIQTILKHDNGTEYFSGFRFLNAQPFFTQPISSQTLGINVILKTDLNAIAESFPITEIITKCLVFPTDNKSFVSFPIIHTLQGFINGNQQSNNTTTNISN